MGEQEVVMLAFRVPLLVLLLVSFSACGLKPPPMPKLFVSSEAVDAEFRATIGEEFDAYSLEDPMVTEELRAADVEQLGRWSEFGSDWITYDHVSGRYRLYIATEPDFTFEDREVRRMSVLRWEKNVEKRRGPRR